MKSTARIYLILMLVFLLTPSLAADAVVVPLSEALLGTNQAPTVIHAGMDYYVYVIDEDQGTVWRMNPLSGSYEKHYPAGELMDAVPDGTGKIWWTGGANSFGYIDTRVTQNGLATWTAPEYSGNLPNLGPLVVLNGKIWMATYFSSSFGIFQFDPATRQFCHYPTPGGSYAASLVTMGGSLWWLSWNGTSTDSLNSLQAVTPTAMGSPAVYTSYALVRNVSTRAGLAADQDNLWWAEDRAGGDLYRFTPNSAQITTFDLPANAYPLRVALFHGRAWYTDANGSFASLDPETTANSNLPLSVTDSRSITPDCLDKPLPEPVLMNDDPVVTGTLVWSETEVDTTQPQTGLEVYPLPSGSLPWGIAPVPYGIWVTDSARGRLVRLGHEFKSYLPLARR